FFFFFYVNIALYAGFSWIRTLVVFGIAVRLTFFLRKFFKKIIVFQLILALIGIFTLVPVVINQLNYSKERMNQSHTIESAVSKNILDISFNQSDGYVNFSAFKNGNHEIENSEFEPFLADISFKNYPNFRSNYAATLPTNSSVFMMKHH